MWVLLYDITRRPGLIEPWGNQALPAVTMHPVNSKVLGWRYQSNYDLQDLNLIVVLLGTCTLSNTHINGTTKSCWISSWSICKCLADMANQAPSNCFKSMFAPKATYGHSGTLSFQFASCIFKLATYCTSTEWTSSALIWAQSWSLSGKLGCCIDTAGSTGLLVANALRSASFL